MKRIVLLFVAVFTLGCGSSNNVNPIMTDPGNGSPITAQIDDINGGSLAHPTTGHKLSFSQNGLSADATATLSLLPEHLPTTPHPDFATTGTAFQVELTETEITGAVTAFLPLETGVPSNTRIYWMLANGVLYPLDTSFDPQQQLFSATIPANLFDELQGHEEFDTTILSFGLLDETQFLSRPDHVDWPSYNLYVFENRRFVKYLDQGRPVEGRTLPSVGNTPLMVVHGLGSNIPNFDSTVIGIIGARSYSTIYGFEYDTLSSITKSGPRLREAFIQLEQNTGRDWHHLAHSMGCVISRQAMENGGSLPYRSNNVVLAAGPHIGSPIINALQDNGFFTDFITMLVVNNVMDFRNADGTPCKVSLTDPGFVELAAGSTALATLNNGAAGRHPKETYRTLGGNRRSWLFFAANTLAGIYLDDGFVNLVSANPGALIGTAESRTVPNNHLDITTDARNGLRVILDYLTR
jgi:pimeloyl-ACP methyl ester carboxylesterase